MRKFLSGKYSWLWVLVFLVGVNLLAARLHKRFDLTTDKRYSLSSATKQLLRNLDGEVEVEVFLKGDFPATFRHFANNVREFLAECREYSNNRLNIFYTNPFKDIPGGGRLALDSLEKNYDVHRFYLGNSQVESDETMQFKTTLPAAIIRYKGKELGLDMLRGVSPPESEKDEDIAEFCNRVENTLEYKLAYSIQKITAGYKSKIAYALGNGEPWGPVVDDAIRTLIGYGIADSAAVPYRFDTVNIHKAPFIPGDIDGVLIVKPAIPFSEVEKLKIDQYLVNGGNVYLMMDALYAEFDSLWRNPARSFTAFDRALNLDDMLFKYGVRINRNLLLDNQSDKIPHIGEQGQREYLGFPYFPLLNGTRHPISNGLNFVRTVFPNTIDTIAAPGIQKSILLTSSGNARVKSTPAVVDLEFMQYLSKPEYYKEKDIPVAALLEGKFTSFFNNRLTQALRDSLAAAQQNFVGTATKPGKLIVVADGDLAMNFMNREGPLNMGSSLLAVMEPDIKLEYANKDFFLNSIEYLVNKNNSIAQTRGKNFTPRILDPNKKEKQGGTWKILSTVLPIVLVLLAGLIHGIIRKKKYTGSV